jgi:hypothetical protein
MGAGLAIVAVVGAILSYVVVQPSTLLGSLATLCLSGSAITLAVSLLAASRTEAEPGLAGQGPGRPREDDEAVTSLSPASPHRERVLPT